LHDRSVLPPDLSWREACDLLHAELDRLPDRYRLPLLHCYLEGKTRDQAAAALGVSVGVVKGRISRGRDVLRKRLARRGVTLSVGLLAASTTGPVRASLASDPAAVTAAVRGAARASVTELAEGVVRGSVFANVAGVAALGAVAMCLVAALVVRGIPARAKPPESPVAPSAAGEQPPERDLTPGADNDRTSAGLKCEGRVVGPDGRPVADATVVRLDHRGYPKPPAEVVVGKTDAAGRFEADAPPYAQFAAGAAGFAADCGVPNRQSGALTLRLAKAIPVRGRLLDLEGRPVAGAKVRVEAVSAAPSDDLTAAYNAFRANPGWTSNAFDRVLTGEAAVAPRSAATDKNGRFEIAGVGTPRVLTLRFEAAGIEAGRVYVFADPDFAKKAGQPAAVAREKIGPATDYRPAVYGPDFTHVARPSHVVTGTVSDSGTGKPLAGVTVTGTAGPVTDRYERRPWADKVTTTTDAEGKFRLDGLPKAGTRYLHAACEALPYLDQVVEVADTAGFTPARADIRLRPAVVIEGRLVNAATGKPVRGEASWAALEANRDIRSAPEHELYTGQLSAVPTGVFAFTGGDGRFRLRVPAGPGVVSARADGFDPAAVFAPARARDGDRKYLAKNTPGPNVIRVAPAAPEDEESFDVAGPSSPLRWFHGYVVVNPGVRDAAVNVEVGFDPGKTVALKVTDPDGKPLAGANAVGTGTDRLGAMTFPTGEIPVRGLDPRDKPRRVFLLHPGRALCGEVEVRGDEKEPPVVMLRPCGAVTGRVVDHQGKPVPGAVVAVQMRDGVADEFIRQKLYRNDFTADKDGRFDCGPLFPGLEFDIFAGRPGIRVMSAGPAAVTLKPGERREIDIKLLDPKAGSDD
jgi:hypothetical protein